VKVALLTLGCDKNTVDSERYLAELVAHGATPTRDVSEAEVILVNTCGFIDAAKQESIDAIVQAGQYKGAGACQAVVAVGCMVQRHKAELAEALPEVDLFLGASEMDRLIPALAALGVVAPEPLAGHPGVRAFASRHFDGGLAHVRYLKVSEGCDHGCAFCAIPLMRGRHRSFATADVVREAQLLELQGAREVNLVAQDLAHYGRDRADGVRLPELLEALLRETGVPWYRNLYLYPTGITPRLLEVIAANPRVVRYLDMPVQHASDAVLARMRRPERERTIREKVARFRDAVPGVAVRTTCIVGFPGETDDDFRRLLDFVEEVRFDRVGAFTYSPQEGTRAYDLPDDVPDVVKRERLERLLEVQRRDHGRALRGAARPVATVLVDVPARRGAPARLPRAVAGDDVDGVTWVRTDARRGASSRCASTRWWTTSTSRRPPSAWSTRRPAPRGPAGARAAGRGRPAVAAPAPSTVGSFGR
jgi:ribosomal protein S12 methylthiotransferase